MRKLCENYLFLTEFKCQTFIIRALSKNLKGLQVKGLKFLLALSALCGVLFMAGCGEKKADEVAMAFTEALYDKGDAKKALEQIFIDKELTNEEKQMLDGKFTMLAAGTKEQADKLGGIKSIKPIEVDVRDGEPKTASVALEIVFKDDSIKKEQLNLRHTKDGWKVLLK